MGYTDKYSIGLTGGIGCGKTSVTNIFAEHGVGIIDADEVSRSITADHQPAINLLTRQFGNQILSAPGILDRAKLRALVFSQADKKLQLEAILHPLIQSQMQKMAHQLDCPYLIFSIPLLVEIGQSSLFDRVLVIQAPKQMRITWIEKRNGLSKPDISKIMKSQASDNDRLKIADDVLENKKSIADLQAPIAQLHQQYLKLAKSK